MGPNVLAQTVTKMCGQVPILTKTLKLLRCSGTRTHLEYVAGNWNWTHVGFTIVRTIIPPLYPILKCNGVGNTTVDKTQSEQMCKTTRHTMGTFWGLGQKVTDYGWTRCPPGVRKRSTKQRKLANNYSWLIRVHREQWQQITKRRVL